MIKIVIPGIFAALLLTLSSGNAQSWCETQKQFNEGEMAVCSTHAKVLDRSMRVAQACGWYAIYSCSQSRDEARRFSHEYGLGYVIDTSSDDYPNFRGDYFCVVEGPMSRSAALSKAEDAHQFAPSAHAKSAC